MSFDLKTAPVGIPTTQSNVEPLQSVKPRVDFRKAAKLHNLADKTHTVYNKGFKHHQELAKKLEAFGVKPEFTAEKLSELEIDPDTMTVTEALKAIENYNQSGKKEVQNLARKNVRIETQIKEENKVNEYAEKLWNSKKTQKKNAEIPAYHFRAIYYKKPRYETASISPVIGFIAGAILSSFTGNIHPFSAGLAGLVAAHLYNQSLA